MFGQQSPVKTAEVARPPVIQIESRNEVISDKSKTTTRTAGGVVNSSISQRDKSPTTLKMHSRKRTIAADNVSPNTRQTDLTKNSRSQTRAFGQSSNHQPSAFNNQTLKLSDAIRNVTAKVGAMSALNGTAAMQ